jgi:hypothetical protein
MQMVPRVTDKPAGHLRHLMGAVVVHDDVHLSRGRELRINAFEKFQELLVPMPPVTMADDLARRHVQRGKQRRRAVPNVIVRLTSRDPRAHRQERSGAIQRLDLTLFIETEHQRMVGRIQIQPDDVAHFLDKLRVGRQLERLQAMRLQAERPPDARDRGFRQASHLRHAARGPLGGVRGWRFERPGDHVHEQVVRHLACHAGPRFIGQPCQAANAKALPPLADAVARHMEEPRDRAIGLAVGAGQHHAGTHCHALRARRPTRPLFQGSALVFRQRQRFRRTSCTHAAAYQSARHSTSFL